MSHDAYELPSMYTRKAEISNNNNYDSEDEEDSGMSSGAGHVMPSSTTVLPTHRNAFRDSHVEDNRLAWLLLGTSLSILLMTVIPVLADIPYVSYPWFSGNSLFRLFDPLITLPLNLFIITRADVMSTGRSNYCNTHSPKMGVIVILKL